MSRAPEDVTGQVPAPDADLGSTQRQEKTLLGLLSLMLDPFFFRNIDDVATPDRPALQHRARFRTAFQPPRLPTGHDQPVFGLPDALPVGGGDKRIAHPLFVVRVNAAERFPEVSHQLSPREAVKAFPRLTDKAQRQVVVDVSHHLKKYPGHEVRDTVETGFRLLKRRHIPGNARHLERDTCCIAGKHALYLDPTIRAVRPGDPTNRSIRFAARNQGSLCRE